MDFLLSFSIFLFVFVLHVSLSCSFLYSSCHYWTAEKETASALSYQFDLAYRNDGVMQFSLTGTNVLFFFTCLFRQSLSFAGDESYDISREARRLVLPRGRRTGAVAVTGEAFGDEYRSDW